MNDKLINASFKIVAAGAQEYLRCHNLRADDSALLACCKSWLKIELPNALRDAKEAMDCHMPQVAETTFKATLFNAGIEAAKEAAQPVSV